MNTNVPPSKIHLGWNRLTDLLQKNFLTRRQFIPSMAAAAGAASLFPSILSGQPRRMSMLADQANWHSNTKIKHVVILCQENRSFDHYFGSFANTLGTPDRRPLGFNPTKVSYRDSSGKVYRPFHDTTYCDNDPDHSWEGSHTKWDNGKMDGFVIDEGGATTALGYYEAADHIYHVQLAQAFTLCDHYFCPQIGPTLPNRLYLWSGTSGWDYLSPTSTSDSLPFNNPSLTAPPPVLTWPTMADVLDAASLPWKCYSVADGSVPSAIGAFNPLIFFQSMQTNPSKLAKATATIQEFFTDLATGTLPAVSWIVTEATVCEHPPAPPDMGQLFVARVVQELMASSAWESTALFVTYDEGGGFFETVPPYILEYVPTGLPDADMAVGPAFRVPTFIVSPYAQPNYIFRGTLDHTSILQAVERNFTTKAKPIVLPTINPARRSLHNLFSGFNFNQTPISPSLPTPAQLYSKAKNEVLVLRADGTVEGCSTNAPKWLPGLLGVST
jgi:phospholipase C